MAKNEIKFCCLSIVRFKLAKMSIKFLVWTNLGLFFVLSNSTKNWKLRSQRDLNRSLREEGKDVDHWTSPPPHHRPISFFNYMIRKTSKLSLEGPKALNLSYLTICTLWILIIWLSKFSAPMRIFLTSASASASASASLEKKAARTDSSPIKQSLSFN